jgi:hypothetical protein
MKVGPVVSVGFPMILDEICRIAFFLADPATPEIVNALLVASGADDPERVKVHRTFDNVGGTGLHPFSEDRVSFEQNILQ